MHWINDQRGRVGNVLWNCPGGISRGREVLRDLGDVRGKCPDTVPEWHKRNLGHPTPDPPPSYATDASACYGNIGNMLSLTLCATYILRSRGLSDAALHVVSRPTTLARLLYAAPPRGDLFKLQTDNDYNASSPESAEWDISPRTLPPSPTWSSQLRNAFLLLSPRVHHMFFVPFSRHWSLADPVSDTERTTFHYPIKTTLI